MNKNAFSILGVFILCFSCNESNLHKINYHSLKGDIISDSIFSRMPGDLYVLKNHIVWHDPFDSEGFTHYIDKHTKKEIVAIGNIGQGPNEFQTPDLSQTYDNNILIYDLNSDKQAILITDSVVNKKQDYFVFIESNNINNINTITRKKNIHNNTFVTLEPKSEDGIFRLLLHDKSFNFGEFFMGNAIENAFSVYQGHIGYNNDNNIFVYANNCVSYISIYKLDEQNRSFSLLNEIIEDYNYNRINNKNLTINKEKRGCMGLALSKDFIILQKRDYKSDNTNENEVNPNSFDKLPRTVFLYDYKGNLKHIVNLEVPILRIAANIQNNELYIISVNPEYFIMKYDLDTLFTDNLKT